MKPQIFKGKIQNQKLAISKDNRFALLIETLEGCEVEITIRKKIKSRTSQQNRALHLYFTLLSEALNDAGYDMKKTIRQDVDIPWTPENVKESLWRPIQKAYLNIESTTKLKTGDIDKVYDVLNKTIGERTGVYIPWPCMDNLMN